MMRVFWLLSVVGSLFLVACGSAGLATNQTTPDLVQIGQTSRTIQSLTDLDDVREIAIGGERAFLATDYGVVAIARSGDAQPRRFTTRDGLPSNDVRSVQVTSDGTAILGTSNGIARLSGETISEFASAPPVGELTRILVTTSGDVWAGGIEGIAQLEEGVWTKFGETATVTLFAQASDGAIWVGTTNGLWRVEGDIIREHSPGRGLPEGYVRALVPQPEGKAYALLQGPSRSQIAYFENDRWFGYSLKDFAPNAIDLVTFNNEVLLITPGQAYSIRAAGEEQGTPLDLLSRSEPRTALSYRARRTAVEDFVPAVGEDDPHRNPIREPSPLETVPDPRPQVQGPNFIVDASTVSIPSDVYWAQVIDGALYLAEANRGVARIDAQGNLSHFRSLDLVRERDLQIAIDAATNTWILGRDNDVAVYENGSFSRVDTPAGVTPMSIASHTGGAYVMTRVGDTSTVRLYRVSRDGWTQEYEKDLAVPNAEFVSIPFFGLAGNLEVWAGIRASDEHGERIRGAVHFSASSGPVFYHRGANPETDGEGALTMPDEIDGVDTNMQNYIWFPSLNGAIRVGNSQAVVFGEARGVRGEVVTDLLVGDNDRVWLAAAEGVGYYESTNVEFRLPAVVQQARPTALAADSGSNLWGVGLNGVVYFDGTDWLTLTVENGLPTNALVDVEVDSYDRVWILAEDRLILFTGTSNETP